MKYRVIKRTFVSGEVRFVLQEYCLRYNGYLKTWNDWKGSWRREDGFPMLDPLIVSDERIAIAKMKELRGLEITSEQVVA